MDSSVVPPSTSAAPPDSVEGSQLAIKLPVWVPPLLYLLLALCFLWRSSFTGDVFLPARLLGYIAPWKSTIPGDSLPPWNPLRWDGIGQFFPWRHFAHQAIGQGQIPLWNPYQFCGTPFVANSQSAVFYPGNLLFYLLPAVRAFGASAVLHLTLCGWFTYLLLRRLGAGEAGALLAGVIYAFSAWQVQWLQLPTFLATSCWIPLLLRQVHLLSLPRPGSSRFAPPAGLATVLGIMLLGGHLQIAFYGLFAGTLFALALLAVRVRKYGWLYGVGFLGRCTAGLALGMMLALPQVLPSLELSRMSHRQGSPNGAGYAAYVEYALPPGGLMGLTLPEFFGTDYDPNNPYYGFYVKHTPDGQPFAVRHNAAETAVYVGILPLLLALLALSRMLLPRIPTKPETAEPAPPSVDLRVGSPHDMLVLFFGTLALLALLMALGTPIDALFYFGVPGFGQSGSPARCLVLLALSLSVLAGFGLDGLLRQPPSRREVMVAIGGLLALFVMGLSLTAQALRADIALMNELKIPVLGEAFGRIGAGWIRLFAMVGTGTGLLFWTSRKSPPSTAPLPHLAARQTSLASPLALTILLLTISDLFITGMGVNPTAPAEVVYPLTPGIRLLQEKTAHVRILPVNKFWNQNAPPPAVLPPNAGMVYGLRDVQGYDSLLTGNYKRFADRLARPNQDGSMNASPVEVGNMVFIQNPLSPLVPEIGATYAITLPTSDTRFGRATLPPASDPIYNEAQEMAIYPLTATNTRAHLRRPDGTPVNANITFERDDATRVALRVVTPEPARMVLADAFYPGWIATVDGHPVPIAPAGTGGVFRSVEVPEGIHTIDFHYVPTSFRVGLYLALFSLMLILLILVRAPSHLPRQPRK